MKKNSSCYLRALCVCCVLRCVSIAAALVNALQSPESKEILFNRSDQLPVTVRVKNETTGSLSDIHFNISESMLRYYNITLEQVNQQIITKDSNGEYNLHISPNTSIPIVMATEQILNFVKSSSKHGEEMAYSVSKAGLMSLTVEDLKNSSSLKPVDLPEPTWPVIKFCNFTRLRVTVAPNNVRILLGNKTIEQRINEKSGKFKDFWTLNRGLALTIINPLTCEVTLRHLYRTTDFAFHRDLVWILEAINPGRIAVLMSMVAGSVHLDSAREKMSALGSAWAPYYQYRDGWLAVFASGGKFVSEALIPNLGNMYDSGSPVVVELQMPGLNHTAFNSCYSSWSSGDEWNKRRSFCETYDGFFSLCNCQRPFVLRSLAHKDNNDTQSELHEIPLLISSSNRTRELFRLIESVGSQTGVWKERFLIFTNVDFLQTRQLAHILGIRLIFHRSNLDSAAGLIANNLQFGLYEGLRIFPEANYFIVLEEDLILSPDFYRYMNHFAPIFERDKSIFCVAAFNHLSYLNTGFDPTKVYRVTSYPAYGWMMSRELVKYVVPKFLPGKVDQDWDYFMGSNLISKGKEIIVPDINRSYHWAIGGIHNKGSLLSEECYLSRGINKLANVSYVPIESVTKETYEEEYLNLLQKAKSVSVTEDLGNFSLPIESGKLYKIFVRKSNNSDESAFQLIAEMLKIWYLDGRDHHNHSWRVKYNNATLFVIGVPLSPYKNLMTKNDTYMSPLYSFSVEDHLTDRYSDVKVLLHSLSNLLPEFE